MMFIQKRIFLLVAAAWSVQGQSLIRGGSTGSTTSMTDCMLSSSLCNNTAPHTKVDAGCNADFPICTQESGWEPPASVAGDKCSKCINIYDSDIAVDLGCNKDFPRCDAPLGLNGLKCLAPEKLTCANTQIDTTADRGCAADAPVCYNVATGMDVGYGAAGNGCARCINTLSQGYHDVGVADYACPANSPRCVSLDGTDAPENKIGARCCPASGCATPCPCNTPNSYFRYIVENGVNLASMNVECYADSITVVAYLDLGLVAGGEPMPGVPFYACESSGGFPGDVGYMTGITMAQAATCAAEVRRALAAVACGQYGYP